MPRASLAIVQMGNDAVGVPLGQWPQRRLRGRRVVEQPSLRVARIGANPQQHLPMKTGVLTH